MQVCGIESANQRISESALDSGWQTAEFDVEWGKGINRERDIPNIALAARLITGAGGYLRYDDEMRSAAGARPPRHTWPSTRS